MMNPTRFSNRIMSKEHKEAQSHLLEIYDRTSQEEKNKIKKMMKIIKINKCHGNNKNIY